MLTVSNLNLNINPYQQQKRANNYKNSSDCNHSNTNKLSSLKASNARAYFSSVSFSGKSEFILEGVLSKFNEADFINAKRLAEAFKNSNLAPSSHTRTGRCLHHSKQEGDKFELFIPIPEILQGGHGGASMIISEAKGIEGIRLVQTYLNKAEDSVLKGRQIADELYEEFQQILADYAKFPECASAASKNGSSMYRYIHS